MINPKQHEMFQGVKTSEACGRVVQQGVSDNEERELILRLHNQLRAKIANGLEERGDPGPQPTAANMMEMVRNKCQFHKQIYPKLSPNKNKLLLVLALCNS
jgi:hypothetical protein